jgi:hypothetical protein
MMDISLPEILSAERSLGIFLLVTVAMGGGAAYLAGRAIAATWRPWWHVIGFMALLALAVRFMHFALFNATMLSVHYYVVDAVVCLAFGFLGFRLTRVRQMVNRYSWLHERAGLFGWRRREPIVGRSDAVEPSQQR